MCDHEDIRPRSARLVYVAPAMRGNKPAGVRPIQLAYTRTVTSEGTAAEH